MTSKKQLPLMQLAQLPQKRKHNCITQLVKEANPVDVESGAYYGYDMARGFEILRSRYRVGNLPPWVGNTPAWSEMSQPKQLDTLLGIRFLALADIMNAKTKTSEIEATFDYTLAESILNLGWVEVEVEE